MENKKLIQTIVLPEGFELHQTVKCCTTETGISIHQNITVQEISKDNSCDFHQDDSKPISKELIQKSPERTLSQIAIEQDTIHGIKKFIKGNLFPDPGKWYECDFCTEEDLRILDLFHYIKENRIYYYFTINDENMQVCNMIKIPYDMNFLKSNTTLHIFYYFKKFYNDINGNYNQEYTNDIEFSEDEEENIVKIIDPQNSEKICTVDNIELLIDYYYYCILRGNETPITIDKFMKEYPDKYSIDEKHVSKWLKWRQINLISPSEYSECIMMLKVNNK